MPEHLGIDEIDWLSPTRLLVTIDHRYSELLPPYPTGQAFAIERDGTKREDLYCCRPVGLWGLPVYLRASRDELLGVDGERHIVFADHDIRRGRVAREADPYLKARVYRLDTYTGDVQQIDIAPLHMPLRTPTPTR